jgi:hypothetical protein
MDGHKHNSTMVSDASPGTPTPKMNESFIHMAHVSFDDSCAQDGYLKHPHPTIIDGDMRWDSGWFLGLAGNVGCWHVGQRVKTTDIFYVGNMSADMSANMLRTCPKTMSAADH